VADFEIAIADGPHLAERQCLSFARKSLVADERHLPEVRALRAPKPTAERLSVTSLIFRAVKMVARDGIEPPMPAFSGLEKRVFLTT
jgi:hypothetical protein